MAITPVVEVVKKQPSEWRLRGNAVRDEGTVFGGEWESAAGLGLMLLMH